MALRIHRYNETAEEALANRLKLAEERKESAENVAEGVAEALAENPEKKPINRFKPVRAARNAGITPLDNIFLKSVPLAVIAAAVFFTTEGNHPQAQCISYVLTLVSMIAIDPLKAITFFLAPQTRFILSADLLLLLPAIITQNERYSAITIFVIACSVITCRLGNRNWLYCYNWLASASAQKAVTKCPEAKGYLAWENNGKREVRAALAECGLKFNEDLLDSYGMTCFLTGFYAAHRKMDKLKRRAGKAQEEIENMLDYAEELEEANEDLTQVNADQERSIEELREKSIDYKAMRNEKERLETSIVRLNKELTDLKKANAELLATVPEEEKETFTVLQADIIEHNYSELDFSIMQELRISEELRARGQKGKGTRAIAKEYNVTRYYVEGLQKELRKQNNIINFPIPEEEPAAVNED